MGSNGYVPVAPPNPPNDGDGAEPAGAVPVEAPPNMPGLGASPVFAAVPNPPNADVDGAPAVAPPPPKRPPGLLAAGVPDAPPKRPPPPELAAAPPNNPVLGVLEAGLEPPKSPPDEVPVVLPAPPKSPPAGLGVLEPALLLLCCPKVKPDMVAFGGDNRGERELGCVAGCWLV